MKATLPMRASAAAYAVLLILPTIRAGAQQSAAVAVTGGVATDQRGVRSNALTLAPELHFDGALASLQLGGSATRFESDVWSLGGGASVSARHPLGQYAALTLNASGNLARLGGAFSATYTEAAAVPALELTLRRLTLFGGVRAARGSASTRENGGGLPLPGSGSVPTTSVGRGGAGPLLGGVISLSQPESDVDVRIGAREDRIVVSHVSVADRSASLSLAGARARATFMAGARSASDERAGFGNAAFSLMVTPSASLEIAGGRYPSNRLLGTPAGRFMNAGIALRVGGLEERPAAQPSGVRAPPAGTTRLALRAPDATRVEIAGDFNEWRSAPATRATNGVWYADLRIAPGRYRYAFRVNGREWRVPDGATAVNDGFGGKSAWITVRDKPSK